MVKYEDEDEEGHSHHWLFTPTLQVSDVLGGLHTEVWQRYRRRYRSIREQRGRRLQIARAKEEAKKANEQSRPNEAALVLVSVRCGINSSQETTDDDQSGSSSSCY